MIDQNHIDQNQFSDRLSCYRRMNCLRCTAADADEHEAAPSPHRGLATTVRSNAHTHSKPESLRMHDSGGEAWAQPVDYVTQEPFEAEGPRRPHILPCGHSVSRKTLHAVRPLLTELLLRPPYTTAAVGADAAAARSPATRLLCRT